MARYKDIAADLQARIGGGEFPVGSQLPTIAVLQEHYGVAALNTVRQAQQILVDAGLVETRQGVGVFVLRTKARPQKVDVLAELRAARTALTRAIAALERAGV